MTISALVFDMDGTLLDTLQDLADSTNYALRQHGFAEQPTAAYRYFVGSGARELIRRALPETATDTATIDAVLATYKTHYNTNWRNQTQLYQGIAELLSSAEAAKLKLAVLTNKPQAFADVCVAHFLAHWSFNCVQGQVDGIPHKPDRAMSSLVSAALEVAPENVLYVGDSDIDMKTAANAGYRAVGVTWGFRSREELQAAGAEFLIDHPEQLLDLLGRC